MALLGGVSCGSSCLFEGSELLLWWSFDLWSVQNSPEYYLAGRVSSWLPSHEDAELSALSPALCLPACRHASCYDANELNI